MKLFNTKYEQTVIPSRDTVTRLEQMSIMMAAYSKKGRMAGRIRSERNPFFTSTSSQISTTGDKTIAKTTNGLRETLSLRFISLSPNEPVGKVILTSEKDVFGGLLTPPKYEIVDCGSFYEITFFRISPKNLLGDFFYSYNDRNKARGTTDPSKNSEGLFPVALIDLLCRGFFFP
jgi:hypothetical protein